jgi:hypothetical protein
MRILLLLAALTAMPAAADPAADYDRFLQLMPLAPPSDPDGMLAYAEGLVTHLTGRWVNVDVLFGGRGEGGYDAEIVGVACEKSYLTLDAASPFSLSYTNGNDKSRIKGQLQWAGGNAFIAVYDEASMRERLFGKASETMKGGALFTALLNQSLSGRLIIMPAGKDIMVIMREGITSDVWARCPA